MSHTYFTGHDDAKADVSARFKLTSGNAIKFYETDKKNEIVFTKK